MVMTTSNAIPILAQSKVQDLLIKPALNSGVSTRVAQVIFTTSKETRFPMVSADPSAAWVAEGQEINTSDMTLDEVTVTPRKLGAVVPVSRELAYDSAPSAIEQVGFGVARDIARKLDVAFFGNVSGGVAPTGLAGQGGVTTVNTGSANWTNIDVFQDALAAAEGVDAQITSWVANPADVTLLSKLKQQTTGSNVPLLTADPTQAARRIIAGVPVYSSSAVTPGVIWGIPYDRVNIVVREDATIEADRSVFFTSDRIAIKGIMRVGFGFIHPAAIVKVVKSA